MTQNNLFAEHKHGSQGQMALIVILGQSAV